jgi:hypothetical protein
VSEVTSNGRIGTASEALKYANSLKRENSLSHNEQRLIVLAEALDQALIELNKAADIARRGKIASTGAIERWRTLFQMVRS